MRIPERSAQLLGLLATLAVGNEFALAGSAADLARIAPKASATVAQLFPGGAVLGYDEETERGVAFLEVSVKLDDRRIEVEVTREGGVGEIESVVPIESLPPQVKETVTTQTGGGTVQSVERHEIRGVSKNGVLSPVAPPVVLYEIRYDIDGARREIVVGANGELQSGETDDDGKDDSEGSDVD